MAEEKSVAEKLDAFLDSFSKRMDAESEERKADRARLDAVCTKMDAAEEEKKTDKARKDAAEKEDKEKADKAKADAAAEEEEKVKKDAAEKEEKAKADAARAADSNSDVRKLIADMEKRLPAQMNSADITKFTGAQRRAEKVVQAFGDSAADRWANGETYDAYRRRLLGTVKSHSAQWKDADLTAFADNALDVVEKQIYADAMQAALSPASVPVGTLRESARTDQTGRQIREFHGDPEATWGAFKYPTRIVTGWQTKFN